MLTELIRAPKTKINHHGALSVTSILYQTDKRGGRPYPRWLIKGFQQIIEECDLNDLELEGYRYAWERGHDTGD